MKRALLFFTLLFFILQAEVLPVQNAERTTPYFKEVWAYVMKGEENWLQPEKPVTDVAYFSFVVNEIGRLNPSLNIDLIKKRAPPSARVHCVISAPGSKTLMYFCLFKDLETRRGLIEDVLRFSSAFDGVQIDFEAIRAEEADAYVSFLQEIKEQLPAEKILSVALPARTYEAKDGFPYQRIGEIADRVLVMAYDEHWRTGSPGTIASAAWCKKVCQFSQKKIPKEKLVMGLPLYGRVWQKQEVARPLKYFQTLDLWKQVGTLVKREVDGTPFFEFEQKIEAVVFYEDVQSLKAKLFCYSDAGVQSIGFWRLSQEPAALWEHVKLED
jgi:spore germination protein